MSNKLDHLVDHLWHHISTNQEYYIPLTFGTGGGTIAAALVWGDAVKLGLVIVGAALSTITSHFVTKALQKREVRKKQEHDSSSDQK